MISSLSPAHAEVQKLNGLYGHTSGMDDWFGVQEFDNGLIGFCLDAGSASPTEIGDKQILTDPFAAAVYRWANINSDEDITKLSDTEAAAVSWLLRTDDIIAEATKQPNEFGYLSASATFSSNPDVVDKIDEITDWANANKFSSITLPKPSAPDSMLLQGTVGNIGLQNSDGDWLSGYPITISTTGPCSTSPSPAELTSSSSAQKVTVSATGNGTCTVKEAVNRLPGEEITIYKAQEDRYQAVSTIADPAPASKTVSVSFDMVMSFQPTVTSQADVKAVAGCGDGCTVTDVITTRADSSEGAGTWVKGTDGDPIPAIYQGAVYFLGANKPSGATVPDKAEPVVTASFTSNGPKADQRVDFRLPAGSLPGYYVFVWTFNVDAQPASLQDYFAGSMASAYNDTDELYLMDWQPLVTSQAEQSATTGCARGCTLTDEITTKADPKVGAGTWPKTATGDLAPVIYKGAVYYAGASKPSGTTVPTGADRVATASFTSNGPVTNQPVDFKLPAGSQAGYYVFVWTVGKSGQAAAVAATIRDTMTSAYDDTDETYLLPWQPAISSQAVVASVPTGGDGTCSLTDKITTSADPTIGAGTWPKKASVTWTGRVFYTGLTTASGTTVPDGAKPVATAAHTSTGPENDAAVTFDLAGEACQPGFYTFVWSTPKTALTTAAVNSSFDEPSELTLVHYPLGLQTSMVAPTFSDDTIYFSDQVVALNLPANFGDFKGIGQLAADQTTATNTLYFFPAGLAVNETNLPQAAKVCTQAVALSPTAITSTPPDQTCSNTAHRGELGTYAWQLVYAPADNSRVAPFTSDITDEAEQYTLGAEDKVTPTVITTIQAPRTVPADGQVATTDKFTVTSAPAGASVTDVLYKAVGDEPLTCADDQQIAAQTLPVTGANMSGETTPVTVDMAGGGTLGWQETLTDWNGNVLDKSECGLTSETVMYPGVSTQIQIPSTIPADRTVPVSDDWQVVGAPADAKLIDTLYKVDGSDDLTCAPNQQVASVTVAVEPGSSAGRTDPIDLTIPQAGATVGWQETLVDEAGTTLAQGLCGDKTETVTYPIPAAPPVAPPATPPSTPPAAPLPRPVEGPGVDTGGTVTGPNNSGLATGIVGLGLIGVATLLITRETRRRRHMSQ